MRIRTKLLVFLVPMAVISVVIMTEFSRRVASTVVTAEEGKRGVSILTALAQDTETIASLRTGTERRILPRLQTILEDNGALYVMALDLQGRVLAHTNVLEMGKFYGDPAAVHALQFNQPGRFRLEFDGQPVLDVSMPVWDAPQATSEEEFLLLGRADRRPRARLGTMRLGLPLHDADATTARIARQVFYIIAVVNAFALGLTLLFLQRILRPVRLLAAATERIRGGERGETVPVLSADEIGDLTRSFNRMSADLAATTVSKDFLDGILKNMLDPLVVTTRNGNIRMVNQSLLDLLGYGESELLGQDAGVLFAEKIVTTSGVRNLETGFRTRAGMTIPILLAAAPILGRDGDAVGFILTAKDILERKLAEEALRDSEARNRALVDAIPDTMLCIGQDGSFRDFKPARERAGQDLPEHFVGRRVYEVLPGPIAHQTLDRVARVLATGETQVFEYQMPGGSGLRDYEARLVVCGGDEILAIVRDITQQKTLQRDLIHAREAALEAVRVKSEFLANMSHEIRTPMNGVMGMTELLLATKLTEEQRDYAETVAKSAEALLVIINDILDFSKIEAGKLDLDHVDFDLRETLDDTLASLALRAESKNLELACELAPGVPANLVGDPWRLRQVLVNLLGNAIKFTETGEVVVHVGTEWTVEDQVGLAFAVRDTGIGIPAEKLDRIFNAFEQADGSTTRRYGGTGLGLAISAQIVGLLGGRIWVESAVGRGSTFHFTASFGLRKSPAAVRAATPPPERDRVRGMRTLVVDDNATNRRILEQMLRGWEMVPALTDGGRAALARMLQAVRSGQPFELVLLDANMPEMDGFALARRIQQMPQLAGATIMMLSSSGMTSDAARCRELGIVSYLAKPVRQADLWRAIHLALGRAPVRRGDARADEGTTPAPAGSPASAGAGAPGPTGRDAAEPLDILLAEDNFVNQKLAVRMLEKRGHRVQVAATGREALAALEQDSFDVVLMDVQMPVMGGLEATAAIRTGEKTTGGHIWIVGVTAHALKGDRERCLAAGMDDYVAKPIQSRDLDEALVRVPRRARSTVRRTPPS